MMTVEQRMTELRQRLAALEPTHCDIIDESYKHRGHPGAATGMSHFFLEISAPSLVGKSRVQQHRMVFEAVGDLMNTELHALRISIKQ